MEDVTHRARICELVSVATAEHYLQVDCRVLGYTAAYVRKNLLSAYLGVNSWLNIIRDYCGDAYRDLFPFLGRDGLTATASRFAAAADALVRHQPIADSLVAYICSSVRLPDGPGTSSQGADGYLSVTTSAGYRPNVLSVQLQICRYLKRMTLQERPTLDADAKAAFHRTQLVLATQAHWDMDVYGDDLASIREVLACAIDWSSLVQELRKMDATSRTFTTGSSSDAGQLFSKKVERLSQTNPLMFKPIMESWLATPSRSVDEEWVDDEYTDLVGIPHDLRHRHVVKLSTAPKALKGPRIIAMEPVNLQTAERYAKDILYRYFPEGINLTDQTPNQELAAEGSRNGRYATIDLSSASDYVTKSLVCQIFPREFVEAIWWMVPTHYLYNKEEYPLYSFATMGNGLTFWVESLTFWAISRVCASEAVVYGDDIVVPTKSAPSVVSLLEAFNFVVNRSKSFIWGTYRESCGVEFDSGIPCHTQYYPRFPVRGEISGHLCSFSDYTYFDRGQEFDSTHMVVELQHRLTNVSLNASRFVADVVRSAHPEMTTSIYGTVCPDLWGPVEIRSAPVLPPCGRIVKLETEGGVQNKLEPAPDLAEKLDQRFCRETWYGSALAVRDQESGAEPLIEHLLYGYFQTHGSRPWRESDGWLPENATLPLREEFVRPAHVVVWKIMSK